MIYGQTRIEHKIGVGYCDFTLGNDKVSEDTQYDHVGIKKCLLNMASILRVY